MKKFLSIILSILMVVTMIPMAVMPASAASTPTPYDGVPVTPQKISSSNYAKLGLTSSNWSQFNGYYAIRNAKELYGFAAVSRSSSTANAVLLQDIVVNANGSTTYDWTPIISSNPGYIYESIFDGNGHYISGLYSTVAIAASGGNNAKFGGFICRLGGTAKNLVIKNSTFAPGEDISTYGGVGAITGYPVSCTIQNCRVENIALKSINDGGQLGGIAGYGNGNSSTIKNCVSINVTFSGGIYTNSIAPKAPYSSCYTSATASHNCTNLSVEHKEVKATCEYPGLSNYKYCLVCGKVTSGTKTETPATGHTLKSATCVAPKTCTICGATEGSVDNTAHSWANNDGICANGCGATCAHKNQTGSACEICGAELHVCSNYNNGFCTECDAYEPAELKDGYYQIKNGGNLFWYANYINTVDRTANAVLVADIDLENRPWTPIGSTGENSNNFRGIFDGQNYTIRGLYAEGGRAGLGFFGEVRTGTVKNFTIYGEVVVNTEVDYVGGVIGSVCGVNGENDLERNGAIIQNIKSYVNLTAKAHGVGMIGGFVGYANHQSLIENCSWYGTFDAGEYRVDSGAGGFIGKIRENTSEVTIRNCGAYGTIKTNYAKNSYNNTPTIYMGGFLSFSNTNANTTLENCLFAGKFERGENLTDEAFLGAFGTLRSVKAIKNCYYLGDDGLEAVHSDSSLKPGSDNVEITKVTEEQLKSGEIAYKLQEANEIWGQSIGTDAYPVLGGEEVYCGYTACDDEAMVYTNDSTVSDTKPEHSIDANSVVDNGDGTHSFTCGDCGATVSDNHDFGSGNTCICGAEIAFTGIVVDDENSDEYRYDETRKTYTIIIPADEVGGNGYLSYDIIGTNLTLIEDTNTLLKVQHENEDGLTSAPDDLLVDVLQDNGYFGWSVLGYGDGEWEKLLYSNDGGMTWTTYTFEVKQAYSITVNASQNGTVTANEYAIEGDNIALNVSPAEGYMLDTLSVTDASGNSVDVENNAFTMPASAVTVTATFAVCDHKDGRYGTATDNGDGTHDATYSCCGATVTEGHSGGTATCKEQAKCEHCGASYGEVNAHDWSNLDGVCANGCGEVCPHEKYTNSVCDKCGYACPHDSYTNGFCTECDAYEPAELNENGYYEIGNAGQLYWFADKVKNDRTNYGSANAILTQNIVVNENVLTADGKLNGFGSDFRAWIPPYAYKGTFDGAGKTVSGLYFEDTEERNVGFIGYLNGGTVKNLTVKDSYFNAYSDVGGIVGSVIEGTVTDCFSSATVIAGSLGYAGGIAGENGAGLVERCANSGFVTSGYEAGGIVGYNHNYYDDPDPAIIRHCYNIGSVSGYTVGGIVGNATQQVGSSVEIDSCWAACELNGTNSVGGLIGHASGSTIRCCSYDKTVFTGNPVGKKTSCNILDSGFKSTEEFASGAAAYLLNGKSSGGFWRQTIGTDAYPGFSGDKVYYGYISCADNAVIGYTNNPNASAEKPGHSTTAANDKAANCGSKAYCSVCESYYGEVDKTNHDETVAYVNGFCPNCDAFEPAELVDGVYEISNAGNLYWFADKVTNENATYGSADAILTCDIRVNEGTMTEASTDARVWTPIGKRGFGVNIPYTGTFEGNGKTVSGLYFNDTSANFSVGLFSLVGEGGKVQNVGIADSYLCGSQSIGAVAGSNYGTVTGCYNTGTVSGTSGVGGVVGSNRGTVTNCYNTGTVSGESSVGGVVGSNDGTVTGCYNTGTVSGTTDVGGVAGNNSHSTVEGCYNTGNVSGTNSVGGVAGSGSTTQGCYNTGTVSGESSVGGVVGSMVGEAILVGCYNSGTVSGTSSVGGVAGNCIGKAILVGCYNSGTVSGTTDVGGVVGWNQGTCTNCYFDRTVYTGDAIGNNYGTATDVEGKSTAQFAGGEVAYLLSQGENGDIWGQTIGTDPAPVFSDAKVYYGYTSCGDTVAKYTNDETISAEKPDHTQKPTYTDNSNGTHSAVYPCCGTTVTEEHDFDNDAHQCVCGYACPHDSYTDGVCDNCDYECPHNYGEGVLTRPERITTTEWDDGFYTYTCSACDHYYQETVKRADYAAYDAVSDDYYAIIMNSSVLGSVKDALKDAVDSLYQNHADVMAGDRIESEQEAVDKVVAEFEKLVSDAEEKIASDEYLKADYTAIDEAIDDIEEKLASENVTDEGKAELEEIKKQLEEMKADENTSKADLAELEKALGDYEAELDKGIEDGTLVKFSGERVFLELAEEAEKKIDEKYGENAFYDFANENRDSFYNLYDKYFFRAAALEGGTMAENAENIAQIKASVDELYGKVVNCIEGTHNYGKGVLTRPTFESKGYYTYTCTLCGHSYTEPTEKADTTALNDASMKVTEYIDNDTLTQEARDEIYKSYRDILENNGTVFDGFGFVRNDLVEEDQPAIDAVTAELQKIIDEAEEKIASGEYVKIDGTKEYNKIATALDAEILENYSQEEFAALAEKAGDEINARLGEIIEKAESLTGTVAENKDALAEIESELRALYAEMKNCLDGVHNGFVYEVTEEAKCGVNAIESATCTLCGEADEREVEGTALEHIFLDYASNGDATCTADGTKTASCVLGCGETDTVTDEGTMLDHADEDGDKICDDCQAEIVDTCPDCGRREHEQTGIPQYICLIIIFIRLVVKLVRALQGVA